MKKEIQYKDLKYARLSNNDIAEDIESVTWFNNGTEVLDSEFSNELEIYYESTLVNEMSPILPLI